MRRTTLLLAVILLAAACRDGGDPLSGPAPSSMPALSGVPDAYAPGRVLARFRPGARAASIAAAHGATVQREVVLEIQMLRVPLGQEVAVARALARNPNVEFAEPDYLRTFGDPCDAGGCGAPSDPFFGYKWDLHNDGSINSGAGAFLASTGKVDADEDWLGAFDQLGSFSGSAKLGIMDTGILPDHQDLTGRVAAQRDFHNGDGTADDDDGHGTHVAGIATAHGNDGKGVPGVAYGSNVELVIAKVCGPTFPPPGGYGCYSSSISEGIKWAVDNGAHVLNLSLGGSTASSTEQSALQYARSNDVLPFCAAGNDTGKVSYPGAFPECVAVSATDWGDDLASYSNFGPEVELSAPGGDTENADGYSYILSAYSSGTTSYAFMAGTSMASPHAAGLATLLHALGVAGADDKLTRMKSSADDLGAAGRDDRFGAGRINVYNAVNGLGGGGGENGPPVASFTFSCSGLSCSFDGSGSADADGSITSYSWSFGDGASGSGPSVSHTYATGGTYTVTLTVTDDDAAPDDEAKAVTVSGGASISLTARGYKVKGQQKADLSWTGATSTSVDVFRNGGKIVTTSNDGAYTDDIPRKGGGSYTYKLCEASTSTCSNEAKISF
ncbi:MAG: S8 family serine peptidase [Gemmatimonadota bacterium]